MGELIPLFSKTNVRFELTAVQRIRYESLQEVLRLRKRKDVPVVVINFIVDYFQKKHEGWTLVMVWGDRVAEVALGDPRPAPARPGWLKVALMIIVIAFERFARGLRYIAGLGSTRSLGSEPRLLESKEYKIRCTRRVFQAIRRIQEREAEAGSNITVDQMMTMGTAFLEFYANERQKHPVELIFQNKARDKGLDWLWEDYLNKFR